MRQVYRPQQQTASLQAKLIYLPYFIFYWKGVPLCLKSSLAIQNVSSHGCQIT